MKKEFKPENISFLDSIDYIDDKILAEVLADVKVPKNPADDGKPRRAWKQIAVFAACMVLLGALIPTVSWMVGKIGAGITPGGNPTNISTEASRVVRNGFQIYGDAVYTEYISWFEQYIPSTGEYLRLSNRESGTDGDPYRCVEAISGIADGKLYYIYSHIWGLDTDLRAAYLDLSSGEAIEICDMKNNRLTGYSYVCGDYYYYSINNSFADRGEIYRISLSDGKEELFLELGEDEVLFMAADGELITIRQYSLNTDSDTQTRYSINAYNISTKSKREISNGVDLSYSKTSSPAYLDGKLYFLAYNQISRDNEIICVDVASGISECVKSHVSSYWWLTDDGIYYFPYEIREVNCIDPLSSVLNALFQTNAAASLCFCDLDGKNDRVIYTNADIAIDHTFSPILADGKFCARFYGSFPSLGLESAYILADIDLSDGNFRRFSDPRLNSIIDNDPAETEIVAPIPESNYIEHVGEVPEDFKEIVKNDIFADLRDIGNSFYVIGEEDGYHYITFVNKQGETKTVKTAKAYSFKNLFLDSDGNYLAVYLSDSEGSTTIVKFNADGNIIFNIEYKTYSIGHFDYMFSVDGGYIFVGANNIKGCLYNMNVRDLTVLKLSTDGKGENYTVFGGNYWNTVKYVEATSNEVSVYFKMSNKNKDEQTATSSLQRFDFDPDGNLKAQTEITDSDIPSVENPLFTVDGKPYDEMTDFFKDYDRDIVHSSRVIEYDGFVLLVYAKFTSDWRHSTHGMYSYTRPGYYYRERVYAAYTKDGKLLWRTAVDATDYEALKAYSGE